MSYLLPEGWKKIEDNSGQIYYLTRHPQVKISKRCQLENYHRRGRYLEMRLSDLDFGTKRRSKKYSYSESFESKEVLDLEQDIGKRQRIEREVLKGCSSKDEEADSRAEFRNPSKENEIDESNPEFEMCCEDSILERSEPAREFAPSVVQESTNFEPIDQIWHWRDDASKEKHDVESVDKIDLANVEEHEGGEKNSTQEKRKEVHLNNERKKLEKAVNKLTLKRENVVDHKKALVETAKLLSDARKCSEHLDLENVNLENIKSRILTSKNAEELIQILNGCSELQLRLSSMEHSKILEQMLRISSLPENPLNEFPLDINKNHYSDIINFALKHAPDVIGLILKIATKNEAPIAHTDVVRCAYIFSTLACTVSRQNNALKKTKSVTTKNHGLTNNGLDVLANVGVFETSRTFRNDRDFLASLSEQILQSYAKISVPQITFDNMDMCIANVMHHMTLSFLEFETEDTSHLSTEEKSFEEALEYFKKETVLITSGFNRTLFNHYKYVAAWTLGRIFGEEVEGFSWMKKVFPKHYAHPNSASSAKKSSIFTQKPLNYSENKNSEMIKIMEHLQWQYLNLVGEQSKDKEAFEKDLKMIYSVDLDKPVRLKAEERIKEEVTRAGDMICHGDLLTDVRFETCKRLRRMGVTAVERFDFLKIFRLGTFHLGMNKIIQDIVAGMKSEVNVEDTLSLGYFKTTLGVHHITNNPDAIKRDGNFECHSQFCEDIGTELLIEAFKTFLVKFEDHIDKTENGAVELIHKFLETMDIKFYYDPDNYEELNVHDDMMSSCKDNAGRTVISLVQNSVEHEGDGLGLRALRTVMIPYFLNRKEDLQDSKYAPRLLFNRIGFLQASQRTQARIDLMACCNPSGKPGHSIARDQQNEHEVRSTKDCLRGLHSQLADLSVEKTILGSNILEIIDGHDRKAMLLQEEAGKSSFRYLSEAQKTKIREEIVKMKPFDYNRDKLDYFDKTRGVFSGLTTEQLERFLLRNRDNFKRNSPNRYCSVDKNLQTGGKINSVDLEENYPVLADMEEDIMCEPVLEKGLGLVGNDSGLTLGNMANYLQGEEVEVEMNCVE